jgi:SAM-dependent methyltransferase
MTVLGDLWNATYGRLFAALYEPVVGAAEKAGLAEMRERLLADASGRTLEIGAGTGFNLPHYPAAVTELVLTEPSPAMAKRLRRKARQAGRAAQVVETPGERLPFPDASFDTVVSTLVLCTVARPAAAVAEVTRVLKPGGRFLFLEHVRSDDAGLARWQDWVSPLTNVFFCGCHPNRPTLATIEGSPLRVKEVRKGELRLPGVLLFERPCIEGAAVKPA